MFDQEQAASSIYFKSNKHGPRESSGWAISYGDMITQLFVFFVIIVSISKVNSEKLDAVQAAMRGEHLSQSPLKKIHADLDQLLKSKGLTEDISIVEDDGTVLMIIKDQLLFDSGSAAISSESRKTIQPVISALKELSPLYQFSIEGHTDDVPIQTGEYASNWHLSASRAISVVELFKVNGIKESRISVRAFADKKPLLPNMDSLGRVVAGNRRMNRRVAIRII